MTSRYIKNGQAGNCFHEVNINPEEFVNEVDDMLEVSHIKF